MTDYWDTSTLLKLYCHEEDSLAYASRIRLNSPIITSSLTKTELYFALGQKVLRNETFGQGVDELFQPFLHDVEKGRIKLISIGDDIHRQSHQVARICFEQDPPVFLRSLDGIDLATALRANCKTVRTTDLRMQAAMPLLGLDVPD